MKMKDLCKSTVAAFLYDSNFKNHNILGSKSEILLGWNPKEHKRRLENFEEPYEEYWRYWNSWIIIRPLTTLYRDGWNGGARAGHPQFWAEFEPD